MVSEEADRHPVGSALNRTEERVHRILEEAGRPLTAYAVLDRLHGQAKVTPPTVYRALGKLIACGLAHRIESLNAYVACCNHAHPGPAAFAICSGCGSVEEFTDPHISRRLRAWSRSHAFRFRDAAVELKGLCAACAT